jgi:hypothetical protein
MLALIINICYNFITDLGDFMFIYSFETIKLAKDNGWSIKQINSQQPTRSIKNQEYTGYIAYYKMNKIHEMAKRIFISIFEFLSILPEKTESWKWEVNNKTIKDTIFIKTINPIPETITTPETAPSSEPLPNKIFPITSKSSSSIPEKEISPSQSSLSSPTELSTAPISLFSSTLSLYSVKNEDFFKKNKDFVIEGRKQSTSKLRDNPSFPYVMWKSKSEKDSYGVRLQGEKDCELITNSEDLEVAIQKLLSYKTDKNEEFFEKNKDFVIEGRKQSTSKL